MLNIVATPIGNLEDMSIRMAKTILNSDLILAEDTRSAKKLLNKASETLNVLPTPTQKVISYYIERELFKLPEVIVALKENKNVSLISDAGMPLISDPGYLLMKATIRENLPFTVIPGPSAVTTALVHSGFKSDKFTFLGFLPKRNGEFIKLFTKLIEVNKIIPDNVYVAFESPHRINASLKKISEVIPDAEVSVSRELTKIYEETLRGRPKDLATHEYKGEITLVIKL